MNYQEQLRQPEWAAKRQEILTRDDFKCVSCGTEKSEYDGWSMSFEEIPSEELVQHGHSIMVNENTNYETVFSMGKQWVNKVEFISKIREPFSLKNVRFSERKWNDKQPKLVFYYSGESENYRLGQLNIHHKFYISGNLAWQYQNEALVTLCYDCHKEVHQKHKIEIKTHDLNPAKSRYAKNCDKCEGTGHLPEFSHRDNGICYPCIGMGVL